MKTFRVILFLCLTLQYLFASDIALTPKEREWIKAHPIINFTSTAEDYPFDFIDNTGKHAGMSSDYIELIEEKTGLKFHLKTIKNWDNILKKLKEGEIDLIPYIFYDEERTKRFAFSSYYTKLSEYFITRIEEPAINSFDDIKDKRFIIVEGHLLQKWVKENYPEMKLITKKNNYDALLALSENEGDVYINDRSTILHIIEKANFNNLKINQRVKERSLVEVRMATKKSYEELASIISKVFNSISEEERFNIQAKWRNTQSTRKLLDGAFGYGRAPYMYGQGSKVGLEFSLVKEALKVGGYTIRDIIQMPLRKGQEALSINKNLEFSVGIAEDKNDGFFYSDPMFFYQNSIITRSKEKIKINSFDDLEDMKISSWDGFYKANKNLLNEKMDPEVSKSYKEFSDHQEQIEEFLSKKSDVVIIDPIIFEWYKNKLSTKYSLVEENFQIHSLLKDKTPAVVAFREKKVRDDFNIGLKKIKERGLYKKLIKDFKTIDLSNQLKRIQLITSITSTYLYEDNYEELFDALRPFQRSSIIKAIEIIDKSSNSIVLSILNKNGKFIKVQNVNLVKDKLLVNDSYYQKNSTSLHVGEIRLYLDIEETKDLEYVYFPSLKEFKHLEENEYNDVKKLYEELGLTNNKINFTRQEIEWIKNNKNIEIIVDPDWLPNEGFNEKGEYIGIVSDYLKHISLVTGLDIKPIKTNSWSESFELAKQKKVSLVSAPSEHKSLGLWYTPTKSYLSSPLCIVMNEKEKFVSSMSKLKGKTIAISKSAANTQQIINEYPDLNFILVDNQNIALNDVALNKYDAAIGSFNVVSYAISVNGLSTLKIVGKVDNKSVSMSFFVNKQDALLLNIINKALENMSQEQEDQIVEKWIQQKYIEKTDYTLVYQIIALSLFLILVFYFWNRKLSKEISARQEAQKELANQLEYQRTLLEVIPNPIFVKDKNAKFTACNQALIDNFNLDVNNYIGKSILEMDNYFDENIRKAYHEKDLQLIKEMGNETIEHKIEFADKKTHDVIFQRTTFQLADGDVGGLMGMFTDITEVKQIQAKLEEKNQLIKDSINYASLIQQSIIPENDNIEDFFKDAFTIWKPRDIVGGDVYFFETLRNDNESLLMVIDCTGHGVPGAFVTMLVKALERNIISSIKDINNEISPARILKSFNKNMKLLLKQETKDSTSNAGFDAAILYINKNQNLIRYSGAEIPLYYVMDEKLKVIKANRHSIGYRTSKVDYEFTDHEVKYNESIKVYLTTDGYVDQTGGEKGFSFGKKRFKDIIENTQSLSMAQTKTQLVQTLEEYQKNYDTNDDITIVGFRL